MDSTIIIEKKRLLLQFCFDNVDGNVYLQFGLNESCQPFHDRVGPNRAGPFARLVRLGWWFKIILEGKNLSQTLPTDFCFFVGPAPQMSTPL
jgi:hypothetical protein